MHLSDFRVKTDFFPLVAITDELVINFRDAISATAKPVLWLGCHDDTTVQLRAAPDRQTLESAVPYSSIPMTAGTKQKVDLTDGNTLDLVFKVTTTTGAIYVGIGHIGEYDAYFKQVTVPNS